MAALLALLLLLPVQRAAAQVPRLSVAITEAGSGLPTTGALRDGLQGLFTAEYGRFVSLSFGSPPQGEAAARIDVVRSAATVTVSTTLARGMQGRSLVSTVPAGAPMCLSAVMAGDLAFLQFSAQDFAAFPPSPPPGMTALLPTDALADLLAARGPDREPLGIASDRDGLTVSFPHGYLSLGPLFRMTSDTARDLFAQAGAREPLQLSGVVRGAGDELALLSQDSGKIARVNPRVGNREVMDAPGLSAVKARMLDADTLADLSGAAGTAGVTLYSTRGVASLTLGDFYASTFGVDGEGNLWVWDIAERRIRIFTRAGAEIFSIKPLFKTSLMPIPQQLEVLDDGSFLLAGSGEVWRFEKTGIPVWRLTRVPGRPGEQLPASFEIAANSADGSFALLDAPSRRLLSFAGGADSEQDLAGFYARLDQRKPQDLQEGVALAGAGGLSLGELAFATLLSQRGGTPAAAAAAGLDVLRDRARLALQLADGMSRDLLYARADTAWLRAGEAARALSAAAPDDAEAAAGLTSAAARRQEIRAALAPGSGISVPSVEVHVARQAACAVALEIRLRLRNDASTALHDVRVHANLTATELGPTLAVVDALGPGEEREVRLGLGPTAGPAALDGRGEPVSLLVTAQRGSAGVTASFSLTAAVSEDAAFSGAERLACEADPSDPLVRSLPEALLGPSVGNADPGGTVIAVFDMMGSLRGAVSAPAAPGVTASLSVRRSLRSLDQASESWVAVMGSFAASQGLRVGYLALPDEALLLVDTGMALDDGLTAYPFLAPYAQVLGALARDGRLTLPFTGMPARSSAADSAAFALQLCDRRGVDGAPVSWIDAAPAPSASPLPVPFPVAFPASPPNEISTSGFFAALGAALSKLPPS